MLKKLLTFGVPLYFSYTYLYIHVYMGSLARDTGYSIRWNVKLKPRIEGNVQGIILLHSSVEISQCRSLGCFVFHTNRKSLYPYLSTLNRLSIIYRFKVIYKCIHFYVYSEKHNSIIHADLNANSNASSLSQL